MREIESRNRRFPLVQLVVYVQFGQIVSSVIARSEIRGNMDKVIHRNAAQRRSLPAEGWHVSRVWNFLNWQVASEKV